MKKLAIITTHPIQYYAPVFQLMATKTDLRVFYTWGEQSLSINDPGFGKTITWDIDLLEGYDYVWLKNTAADPGSHHFNGIVNPDLIQQVQSWQADAVLVIGWAYKSHLKALRYFHKKLPVYFRGDSTLLDEQPGFKAKLKSIFLKWVYSHVDVAFYNGVNNKAYFKKYGIEEEELVFAPHAVDNDRFGAPRTAEAVALRQSLNISENEVLVLFAGKFEPKKNPMLLLEAFLEINKPICHLLFVGNGNLETDLKNIARGKSNVHFMDFQNQLYMPVIYQACDLFTLPSKGPGESWGLAVNEAMACKKAVLVSDKVGCAANLVYQGVNGFIFKHRSKTDLSGCLAQLMQSKTGLQKMGEHSGETIKDWNFERIAEILVNEIFLRKAATHS